jgi:hypothetical protein
MRATTPDIEVVTVENESLRLGDGIERLIERTL